MQTNLENLVIQQLDTAHFGMLSVTYIRHATLMSFPPDMITMHRHAQLFLLKKDTSTMIKYHLQVSKVVPTPKALQAYQCHDKMHN